MHNEHVVRGQLEAQENYRRNIRLQFNDALVSMRRIEREAYDRDQCWARYNAHYRTLLKLAQACAEFGDKVSIPAVLAPRARGEMVEVKAVPVDGTYRETRGIQPGKNPEEMRDFNLNALRDQADAAIAKSKK
jgi:hypothetical protein